MVLYIIYIIFFISLFYRGLRGTYAYIDVLFATPIPVSSIRATCLFIEVGDISSPLALGGKCTGATIASAALAGRVPTRSGHTPVRWRIYKSELVDRRLTVARVELDRKAAGLRSALLLSLCTAICPTATSPAQQMT